MDKEESEKVTVVSLSSKSNTLRCPDQDLHLEEHKRTQCPSTEQSEFDHFQNNGQSMENNLDMGNGENYIRSELVASEMEVLQAETDIRNEGNDTSHSVDENSVCEMEETSQHTDLGENDDNAACEMEEQSIEIDFGEDIVNTRFSDIASSHEVENIRENEIEVGAYEEIHSDNSNEQFQDFQQYIKRRSQKERTDRTIYTSKDSLRSVPLLACPCHGDCADAPFIVTYVDGDNGITMTTAGISKLCRRNGQREVRFPHMIGFEDRLETYETEEFIRIMWPFPQKLARAGFFYEDGKIRCFRCPLDFLNLHHSLDPLREHARWFPCCLHIAGLVQKGDIHDILKDSREMMEEMESRRDTMDMGIVMDLLHQGYEPGLIRKSFSASFFDLNGFPNYEKVLEKIDFIQSSEE